MIRTHTISGSEAQQTIQNLQGINGAQHFISYQVNGTSVVASPNQQYRNDKIGQIEGCLKFFVDAIIFRDPIMGTFKQYYAGLVESYKECENLYKYWNDNIVSLITQKESMISDAEIELQKISKYERQAIRNFEEDKNRADIAQAFIDKQKAWQIFQVHKKAQLQVASDKATATFEVEQGTKNLVLLKKIKQELVNIYRIEFLTLKTQYDQYILQMIQLDKLINDINMKLEPIFLGVQNKSQLSGILKANANQIVNLYLSVSGLYIMTTRFLQTIKWDPYMIEHNSKVQAILIAISVAEIELPFLRAEFNQLKEQMFGQRLELGRLKMEDVSVHFQRNLQIINDNAAKLQDGFRQIHLDYDTNNITGVTSASSSNISHGSIEYVTSVTLTKQIPQLEDFNPYDVVFTEETLVQKAHVKNLKQQLNDLEYEMNKLNRLQLQLQQLREEPGQMVQANLDDLTSKNQTIESTLQSYTLLVEKIQNSDVSTFKITQITALCGIILKYLNVEREACCSSTYNITKYTEINKSFADIVFAQAIREVKHQENSIMTSHSDRINKTDNVQLLDAAKLVTQFEFLGAYQTSREDRQVIRNSVREMDIDLTLFQITSKIAELFVQECLVSIQLSTLEGNIFIQSYKQHFQRPLRQVQQNQVQQV